MRRRVSSGTRFARPDFQAKNVRSGGAPRIARASALPAPHSSMMRKKPASAWRASMPAALGAAFAVPARVVAICCKSAGMAEFVQDGGSAAGPHLAEADDAEGVRGPLAL